jgi:polyribonucleotide nucleotidyltransferase
VLKSQYACLIGLGGSIIKEMVNATGAKIKILDESDVPACGSQYERVLQVIFYWTKLQKLDILVLLVCCFFIFT